MTPEPTEKSESGSTCFKADSRRDTDVSSASSPLRSGKQNVETPKPALERASMTLDPATSAVLASMTTKGHDQFRVTA